MEKFREMVEKHMEKLELYVPVVERVHGGSNPEFYDVRKIFDKINDKIRKDLVDGENLVDDFKELRKITDDYKVPADTCESYEAVYLMLSDLDQAYGK